LGEFHIFYIFYCIKKFVDFLGFRDGTETYCWEPSALFSWKFDIQSLMSYQRFCEINGVIENLQLHPKKFECDPSPKLWANLIKRFLLKEIKSNIL
jgi:hypothetical protein